MIIDLEANVVVEFFIYDKFQISVQWIMHEVINK
jgi:hypothetical protein